MQSEYAPGMIAWWAVLPGGPSGCSQIGCLVIPFLVSVGVQIVALVQVLSRWVFRVVLGS